MLSSVELIEVSFTEDTDVTTIGECSKILQGGKDLCEYETDAIISVVRSYEIQGERFTGWDQADEDDQAVRLARVVIQNHHISYEQFEQFLEGYDGDEFIHFIMYLSNKGYKGDHMSMVKEYYYDTSEKKKT